MILKVTVKVTRIQFNDSGTLIAYFKISLHHITINCPFLDVLHFKAFEEVTSRDDSVGHSEGHGSTV